MAYTVTIHGKKSNFVVFQIKTIENSRVMGGEQQLPFYITMA